MPKKKRTNLSSLVRKYQGLSIVNEIEHNLLFSDRLRRNISDFVISDLYDENNYSLDSYKTLEDSLKLDGFLVPLIVIENDGKFEIINGVKRFLIGKKIGYKEMPYVKAELSLERKQAYIIQNIIEEDDHPLIKTYAFKKLTDKYNYDDNMISNISLLSLNQVKNLKRLDLLPDFIKEGIKNNSVSYTEARSLLNLPIDKQKELYERIIHSEISVRELEKEKRNFSGLQKKRKIALKGKKIIITFSSEVEAKRYLSNIKKEYSD